MSSVPGADKKVLAGVLAIVIPGLGLNRFVLGDAGGGLIRILITVCTCGTIGCPISLIEGIIYLTKTDEEFVETYIDGDKAWF